MPTLTTGPTGPPGSDGSPANVWRDGTGVPSDALGADGDYYLDHTTSYVYQRASGAYGYVVSLLGATGPQGSPGASGAGGAAGAVWRAGTGAPSSGLGVDGDFYINTTTADVYHRAAGAYTIALNIQGPSGSGGGSGGLSAATSPLAYDSGTQTVSIASAIPATLGGTGLSAAVTGLLKGNGTIYAAAVAGTDYLAPSGSGSALSGVAHLTGTETIAGSKTFSSAIIGSVTGTSASITGTVTESQVVNLVSDLAAKAADSAVAHLTGTETIAGTKTFSTTITGSISGNAGTVTNGVVTTGSYADPSWITSLAGSKVTGNITGNAGTVTNGVVTTGSYADPAWITSLAGSKVTGNITGNAASLTGSIAESQVTSLVSDLAAKATDTAVVHLAGTETVTGTKTFSATIAGDISGNAGTVTNGVVTTGSYSNPSWITSLAGSKVSGNITGNAASLTGSITESQVTNLVTDLAALVAGFGSLNFLAGSSFYSFTVPTSSISTSATLGTGTLRLTPFYVPRAMTLTAIGAEVTTIGDVGSKFRLGIYNDNGSGYPGTLLLDAGTIAGDSATVQSIVISQALTPGLYWVGGAVQVVSSAQPTLRTLGTVPYSLASSSIPGSAAVFISFNQTGMTGAFTSPFTASVTTGGSAARIFVKVQ